MRRSLLPLFLGSIFFLQANVSAVPLSHSALTTSMPATGSNNGALTGASASQAYIDDVYLSTITYGGTTFSGGSGQIRLPSYVGVVSSDRSVVNAEFGDQDTNSDGDANPFEQSGAVAPGQPLPDATRESINPAIQDPALTAAFNDFSLIEGTDGEGNNYYLDIIYQNGIQDNNFAQDSIPEMIFFERGRNSDISLQAITGGTLANPVLSGNSVTINQSSFVSTGIFIDTVEITGGQELGAAGVDLTDFGLADGAIVYGVRVQSINNSGADLYGQFLTSVSPDQLSDLPVGLVPEPSTWMFLVVGCGMLLYCSKRSV